MRLVYGATIDEKQFYTRARLENAHIDHGILVGFELGVVHANIHTKKYNHAINTGKGNRVSIADCSKAFHIYAVEWDTQRIDFLVDDRKYFTFRNEGTGSDAWPYDKDQYLILNLAIGGARGGQKGIDNRLFPQRYEIDYVRVYQRAKPAKQRGLSFETRNPEIDNRHW